MRFRSRRGRVEATLTQTESTVLRQVVAELLELLGPDLAPGEDPLAALVGLSAGPVERPADPALRRLLPDAYGDADDAASAEFRRYTEGDLRAGKRGFARAVLASLPAGAGKVVVDRDGADAWLGTLNDLRLALGTRLQVTEDLDVADLLADDPRLPMLHFYTWLGFAQESLLGAVEPRP